MAAKLNSYDKTFKTDHLGQIFLTGVLDVQQYNKVSVELVQWPHATVSMNVTCMMGRISGTTLAQTIGQFPLGTAGTIHTFGVIGPEFSVVLSGGTPNANVPIQGWVFLN